VIDNTLTICLLFSDSRWAGWLLRYSQNRGGGGHGGWFGVERGLGAFFGAAPNLRYI